MPVSWGLAFVALLIYFYQGEIPTYQNVTLQVVKWYI
jgi:hypothetical protein